MAERRALTNVSGTTRELPSGDTLMLFCSKNGTVTQVRFWVGTEAQYNTATSNGTAEDANTLYFRSA